MPSSRACGPGDAHCSLMATDSKEQRFITEFQFKYLPFLCFEKHLTHFFFNFISKTGKNIIFLVLRNIQAPHVLEYTGFILKKWILDPAEVTRLDVWGQPLTSGATPFWQFALWAVKTSWHIPTARLPFSPGQRWIYKRTKYSCRYFTQLLFC